MNQTSELINKLTEQLKDLSLSDQLKILAADFVGKIVFSSSFGQEDQVITDAIFSQSIPVTVFTLDTGRMFEETYKVLNNTIEKYDKEIKVYFPDYKSVEELVSKKGPYSFYESIENRKECCQIRKVEPLKRALAGNQIWITGLRASQSSARQELQLFEYDPSFDIIKFNPLLHWSLDDVTKYLKEKMVPYNSLHDKGFVSIGCAPCTRAIKPGDDIRAGRWWWEDSSKKECGLHEAAKSTSILNDIKKIQ